ncbi:MFS general substrate transporter [Lophium mytilinum]|uniref:MFS general substrate transporter n=1 Tax=Lophium mytilinum TaxID=390894 RepID=A0A6A6QQ07_9PEZI|nr:MFS general substrate transporter [Lophium mytilinum]
MSLKEKESESKGNNVPPSAPLDGAKIKETKGMPTDIVYPSGLKLALIMASIFVGMFLVSLDRLIISTAIPQITNEFNSAGDIGWYGTAYLLTSCAFQLVFGKLYKVFDIKATFLASIVVFEVGSALCGAAPNSIAFILGRAIAGLGSGGVLSGVMVIIVYAVPLHKRPKYQGFFGAVFGISSVAGPLIGGAFTTDVTWRWCFYLNLPLGGAVMILVFFLLHIPSRPTTNIPLKDKLHQLNALGLLALLPGVICLCLALQWGGTTHPWNSSRIIALLILASLLLLAFAFIQAWQPTQAILPPRIFLQRSILAGFWLSSCLGAHQMLFIYYLPLYFQATLSLSAAASGIHLLPLLLPVVLASLLTGFLVSRLGYYTPFALLGVCLTAVGAGLLTTLEPRSSTGAWVGYQFLYGLGFGFAGQAPNMAAQTVLAREEVAMGAGVMFFGQQLAGAVFLSVGGNVLGRELVERLAGVPGVDFSAALVRDTGATELLKLVPAEYREMALGAYNDSLRVVFRVGLVMACLAVIGAAGLEWRSVRRDVKGKKAEGGKVADEGEGGLGGKEEKSCRAETEEAEAETGRGKKIAG